jgi:hypothetical protein
LNLSGLGSGSTWSDPGPRSFVFLGAVMSGEALQQVLVRGVDQVHRNVNAGIVRFAEDHRRDQAEVRPNLDGYTTQFQERKRLGPNALQNLVSGLAQLSPEDHCAAVNEQLPYSVFPDDSPRR